MGYTPFGEFMRILRIKNREVMGDTAKLLGVKTPFVSAVESGKRNVPEEWLPKLIDHYQLNIEEQQNLLQVIDESKTQMKINLAMATPAQRKLAVQFQRSFESLDDKTTAELLKLLNDEEADP